MHVQTFPSGPIETNAYVIHCPNTNQAAIIDAPPGSAQTIISYLEQHDLKPLYLLLTHSHWDHIADIAPLKEFTSAPIALHSADTPNLVEPGKDGLACPYSLSSHTPDLNLEENMTLTIGDCEMRVIHTPGHTPGGVCFFDSDDLLLFSGDTLFKHSIGKLSFPTSSAEAMWLSLQKLAILPPETKVYPGHGPPTFIRDEPWLSKASTIFG